MSLNGMFAAQNVALATIRKCYFLATGAKKDRILLSAIHISPTVLHDEIFI